MQGGTSNPDNKTIEFGLDISPLLGEVELDQDLPFQEMLRDINHERLATRIKLIRLNKDQTQELLETLFAEEITAEFLNGVYRETEGNPFFIEE